jgi:hypothetical protein
MDSQSACRLCAGIADPGACLVDPGKQGIANWIENNLGYAVRFCTNYAYHTYIHTYMHLYI